MKNAESNHGMLLAVVQTLLTCACAMERTPSDANTRSDVVTVPRPVTFVVNETGGTFSAFGATLTVPPGAVSGPLTFTIGLTHEPLPPGFTPRSPVYRFEPVDFRFKSFITASFPFTGDGKDVGVIWSNSQGQAFMAGGDVAEQVFTWSGSTFGLAFVGVRGGTPGSAVARPNCGTIGKSYAAAQWATVICDTLFSCDCQKPRAYETRSECLSALTSRMQRTIDDSDEAGLHYDGDCMACKLSYVRDEIACREFHLMAPPYAARCHKDACNIFYGDGALGAGCKSFGGSASTCNQDMWCSPETNQCEDFSCPVAREGHPRLGEVCAEREGIQPSWTACESPETVACDVYGSKRCVTLPLEGGSCVFDRCSKGLTCDATVVNPVGKCVLPFEEGVPCDSPDSCVEGLHCPVGTSRASCVKNLPNGAPCSSPTQCTSRNCAGLDPWNLSGSCEPAPTEGQPCPDYVCSDPTTLTCAGTLVNSDFVCKAVGSDGAACRGDEYPPELQCDPGLECFNGHVCLTIPGPGEDCSGHYACSEGYKCKAGQTICVPIEPQICNMK